MVRLRAGYAQWKAGEVDAAVATLDAVSRAGRVRAARRQPRRALPAAHKLARRRPH
jgi:hypothetical protein